MANKTLMLLSTQVEERRKALLEDMGRGTNKFESYLTATGEIKGYMIVQGMISDAMAADNTVEQEMFDSTPTDNVVTLEKK